MLPCKEWYPQFSNPLFWDWELFSRKQSVTNLLFYTLPPKPQRPCIFSKNINWINLGNLDSSLSFSCHLKVLILLLLITFSFLWSCYKCLPVPHETSAFWKDVPSLCVWALIAPGLHCSTDLEGRMSLALDCNCLSQEEIDLSFGRDLKELASSPRITFL